MLENVDCGQHGKRPVGVLGESPMADLGKAPQALEDREGMLDLGADTRLATVRLLVGIRQRRIAVSPFVGEILGVRRQFLETLPLRLAPVGAVAVETGFVAMQQVRYLMAVMHVRRCDAGTMDQTGFAIRANMQLHAEVPLVALLGLMHLGVAGFLFILGRGRDSDQRGIDNRAAGDLDTIGLKQCPHLGEHLLAEVVFFEQVSEFQQGRGIRDAFPAQIETAEFPEHRDVVHGVFSGFIGQVEPVGHPVHAQHPLQSNRRPAVASLRVVRFNQRAQRRLWHQALHLRQKLSLPCPPRVQLKPRSARQCHLLHHSHPSVRHSTSDRMTSKSLTVDATYSVFPQQISTNLPTVQACFIAKWYSIKIPEYEELKALDPISQAAGQVHYINRAVSAGLAHVAESRKLVVQYEDFCAAPEKVFESLCSKIGLGGTVYQGPDAFQPSRTCEPALHQKIEAACAEFA